MAEHKHGIYLNPQTNKVRRIGIGVRPPEGPEWIPVTDDPNATIVAIREQAKQQSLSQKPEEIQWDF
jgi:hypothetical protein